MIKKIRLFFATLIYPEIFNTAKFWKESYLLPEEDHQLLGFKTLASIKSNWE